LERDGLVKSTRKGRGHKVSLALTPKGRHALQKFEPDWRLTQAQVINTLGKERWTEILRDLERAALALN
jgi:DNA-binding PadR family transcriptional regulator